MDENTTFVAQPWPSAWSTLTEPIFRAMWLATVVSNIGTWVSNVGIAWLMGRR